MSVMQLFSVCYSLSVCVTVCQCEVTVCLVCDDCGECAVSAWRLSIGYIVSKG